MVLLCCLTLARAMVANFQTQDNFAESRHDLADRFELMKEILTQVKMRPGWPQQEALLDFVRRLLYTIRFLLLDADITETVQLETNFAGLAVVHQTWKIEHPSPVTLFREIDSAMDFIQAHPSYFETEPWVWTVNFLIQLQADLEDSRVCFMRFDTGHILF